MKGLLLFVFALLPVVGQSQEIHNGKLFSCVEQNYRGDAVGPTIDMKVDRKWASFGSYTGLNNQNDFNVREPRRIFVELGRSTHIILTVPTGMITKGHDGVVTLGVQNRLSGQLVKKNYMCESIGSEG